MAIILNSRTSRIVVVRIPLLKVVTQALWFWFWLRLRSF
ncbi:hypothetical protein V12B01_13125 [Vibrio splendidus 12B01]|nr:hypothetical protein V12B01_13125 [Vibrio splendidus 12B01]